MKNRFFSYIVYLVTSLSLLSCYEDKSSTDTNPLPEVVADFGNLKNDIRIGFNDILSIDPKVTKEGVENHADLKYEWKVSTTIFIDTYKTISTDRAVNFTVDMPIDNKAYALILTVTDTEVNFDYNYYFKLFVSSSYGEGILVAYTDDNVTSDLGHIMDTKISTDYNRLTPNIRKGIYSLQNDKPLQGLVTSSLYTKQTRKPSLWITLNTGEFTCLDCEAYQELDTEMIFKPEGFKAFKFVNAHQFVVMTATEGIYSMSKTNDKKPTMPAIHATNGGRVSNGIISGNSHTSESSPNVLWYSEEMSSFYQGAVFPMAYRKMEAPEGSNPGFDWSNLPGKESIAAGFGRDGSSHSFLMRDKTTGNYEIYSIRISEYENYVEVPTIAHIVSTIPDAAKSIIQSAVSFAFMHDYAVMYVATPTGIYSINYGAATAAFNSTPQYTTAAGETITVAKVYQQGAYLDDRGDIDSEWPNITAQELNNRAVYFGTVKNGNQGTVYVIPMIPTQVSSGTLEKDNSKILKYEGFGKILDINSQGI